MRDGLYETVGDADDSHWWAALAEGKFLLVVCDSCEFSWMRPMPACPRCSSGQVSYVPSDCLGVIYTWVTTHRILGVELDIQVPHTTVVVTLNDGARVYGRLIASVPPAAGMPVKGTPKGGFERPFLEFRPLISGTERQASEP